jgi:hypothetical protein
MNDDEPGTAMVGEIAALRSEHRELDQKIRDLLSEPGGDQLEIARLKKRKLALKDRIQQLLDSSVPDIIA